MNERKMLLTAVVGSRLHNLHNEQSDTDRRGIYMVPLLYVVSPYRNLKSTHWVEGAAKTDADDTSYELRHFCKMGTQCNPSVLEVLWSNIVLSTTPLGDELRENKQKFLDSKRIFDAHRGYAANQLKKMNLFEPDPERTPKTIVAYIRVLQQGAELLRTGDFSPQVTKNRSFLLEVKNHFSIEMVPAVGKMFTEVQADIKEAYESNEERFKPDIEWVEQFLLRAYTT